MGGGGGYKLALSYFAKNCHIRKVLQFIFFGRVIEFFKKNNWTNRNKLSSFYKGVS